jgi:esterase/lipase
MFLSGLQDEMISTEHSKELYEVFKGKKEKCWFEGSHNSTRTKEVYDKCFKWVEKCLAIRQEQLPKLGVEPSELRLTDRNYS